MSKPVSRTYNQYFLSYSGTGLPLRLVGPVTPDSIANRNTYFGANIDASGRTLLIHKIVYAEIELEHRYGYDDHGNLQWAEIRADDVHQRLEFDGNGNLTRRWELEEDC